MKLARYKGSVLFKSVDSGELLGTHEFDFYDRMTATDEDHMDIVAKALVLSEASVYFDPRVEFYRSVEFDSIAEAEAVEVIINVDVRIRTFVPVNEAAEDKIESAMRYAEDFVAEMDHEFKDNTGNCFGVDSEIMEVGDIHIAADDELRLQEAEDR